MEYYEHKLDPVGVRPDWLADDDAIDFYDRDLGWDDAGHFSWLATDIELGVRYIRIPADHWAVTALKQGFKPWAGGESAPEDFIPGSGVLLRNGARLDGDKSAIWANRNCISDIIGYKPKAEREPKPDADLELAREAAAEARPEWRKEFLSGEFDKASTEIQTALTAIKRVRAEKG